MAEISSYLVCSHGRTHNDIGHVSLFFFFFSKHLFKPELCREEDIKVSGGMFISHRTRFPLPIQVFRSQPRHFRLSSPRSRPQYEYSILFVSKIPYPMILFLRRVLEKYLCLNMLEYRCHFQQHMLSTNAGKRHVLHRFSF
jgi:hypothetical protein